MGFGVQRENIRIFVISRIHMTGVDMAFCWQRRGCDEEMWSRCPHAVEDKYSPCPMDCCYTACDNPQHELATDLDLLLDPFVDRNAAQKEQCRSCVFFLTTAPKIEKVL